MKRFFYILPLIFFIAWSLNAEDDIYKIKNKHLRVYYSKKDARFSIDLLGETQETNFIFYRELYPLSSYLTIKIDKKIHAFGSPHGKLKQKKITKNRIETEWEKDKIKITQIIHLPQSGDYASVSYIIKNNDKKQHTIGLRLLLDTEFDSLPFYLDSGIKVETETIVRNDMFYNSIYSIIVNKDKNSHIATLTFSENRPDKIIFSNWLKAYCNAWWFPVYIGKRFKYRDVLYPDAAISAYWETIILKPKQQKTISLKISHGPYKTAENSLFKAFIRVHETADKKNIIANAFVVNKTNTTLGPTILSFKFKRTLGTPLNQESFFFTEFSEVQPIYTTWIFKGKNYGYHKYNYKINSIYQGEKIILELDGNYDYLPYYYENIINSQHWIKRKLKQIKSLSSGFSKFDELAQLIEQTNKIQEFLKQEKFKLAYNLAQNAEQLAKKLYTQARERKKRYDELIELEKVYQAKNDLYKLKDVYSKILELRISEEYYIKKLQMINRAIQIQELYNSANDFMIYKSYSQARQIYFDILKLNKKEPRAYYNIGLTYLKENHYDSALLYLKKSLDLDPNFYMTHYQMAIIYTYNKNLAAAKEHLNIVLQLNPDFEKAKELLKTIKNIASKRSP